ncbi:MAG: DNA mismatch repair endonuclease MutL [Treponema sp.]|nr:DNA mismatch repair endonuclease MutL [Treponema sp.]
MSIENPVRSLNPEVARKIAAGEVIDRPCAIVRELLDNAIDSKATSIIVEINGGGIEKIRIIDDGCGMTKEDLQNCARPHATSKISNEIDLMNLSTLGFRGEALASVAAVARLSIISGGWKMRASLTEDHILEPYTEIKGTIVQSEGLFENFPARRQFLKRAATEGVMCKNTFIEKAMSNPQIGFKLVMDGVTKLDLPPNQSLKDRFIFANSILEAQNLFYEVSAKAPGENPDWSFTAVIGEPAVSRSSKKDIFIYTNNRRIQEYSLVQAVEYGGQGFFPNGTYPVAAVFIKVNPQLVDFNIHPAKKEARFYDISDLHHGLSSNIRAFFQNYTRSNFEEDKAADEPRQDDFFITNPFPDATSKASSSDSAPDNFLFSQNIQSKAYSDYNSQNTTEVKPDYSSEKKTYERHLNYKTSETTAASLSDFRSKYLGIKSEKAFSDSFFESKSIENEDYTQQAMAAFHPEIAEKIAEQEKSKERNDKIKFLGSTLGTFLLAEKNNCLYVIDQHAAHERILFDKIMASQGNRQPLLIPYKIKTDSKSQDNQLEKLQKRLTEIGFETKQIESGSWEITSIPERWTGTEYDLRTLIFVKQVEPEQIIRSIAAMTACHAAVKDGYYLDDETAAKLVETAFQLEDPHCPHGRPIYTVFSRQKLFELVKRT